MKFYPQLFGKMVVPIMSFLMLSQPAIAAPIELSLEDSIARALENNHAIHIAETSKEKSTWAMQEAKASKKLTVGYTHTETRSDAPPSWVDASQSPTVSAYNYFSNRLSVSVPLYTGGKLESLIDQAKLGVDASNLNLAATQQQIKLSTTTAYFGVLQTRNLVDIAKQTVDDFSAHLQNVEVMYNTGTVALPDVLQTKVRLANAQNNLIKSQNAYDLTIYHLNNMMGLPLRSELQLKENMSYQKYAPSLDDSIAYALEHRPEMTQGQVAIKIAQDQIKVANSDKAPTVVLSGNNAWNDMEFAGTKNSNWTMNLTATFNVFDSGRTDAQIKQARSGATIAETQARQNADTISLEVSDGYLSMREAEKRMDTSYVAVEESEQNFDIAKERYSAGIGTNLDVMDAELSLAQAKTNYVQALYDYNTSKAQLEKGMGIGVK